MLCTVKNQVSHFRMMNGFIDVWMNLLMDGWMLD